MEQKQKTYEEINQILNEFLNGTRKGNLCILCTKVKICDLDSSGQSLDLDSSGQSLEVNFYYSGEDIILAFRGRKQKVVREQRVNLEEDGNFKLILDTFNSKIEMRFYSEKFNFENSFLSIDKSSKDGVMTYFHLDWIYVFEMPNGIAKIGKVGSGVNYNHYIIKDVISVNVTTDDHRSSRLHKYRIKYNLILGQIEKKDMGVIWRINELFSEAYVCDVLWRPEDEDYPKV